MKHKLMQFIPYYGIYYALKNDAQWYTDSEWGDNIIFFLSAWVQAFFIMIPLLCLIFKFL